MRHRRKRRRKKYRSREKEDKRDERIIVVISSLCLHFQKTLHSLHKTDHDLGLKGLCFIVQDAITQLQIHINEIRMTLIWIFLEHIVSDVHQVPLISNTESQSTSTSVIIYSAIKHV
jgi:hypothetical protein